VLRDPYIAQGTEFEFVPRTTEDMNPKKLKPKLAQKCTLREQRAGVLVAELVFPSGRKHRNDGVPQGTEGDAGPYKTSGDSD
jgi:hypothetical protein